MADIQVTRADREAAVKMHVRTPGLGGVGADAAHAWVEMGDASVIAWGPWRACLPSLAAQIAELRATARAEGWKAGVEEAAKVCEQRRVDWVYEAGHIGSLHMPTKCLDIAAAYASARDAVRALAAREGER